MSQKTLYKPFIEGLFFLLLTRYAAEVMDTQEKKLLYKMRDICSLISKGNYSSVKLLEELSIEGRHPKVFSDLAESFSMMLLKLEAREARLEQLVEELFEAKKQLEKQNSLLKSQVHHLEISIDKFKKAQEVDRIVSTPFFKEIKQKAKKHRK